MAEDSLLGLGAGTPPGGASSAVGSSTVNSRLNVDLKILKGLNDELKTMGTTAKSIEKNFDSLIKKTKELTKELQAAGKAGRNLNGNTSNSYIPKNGMPPAADLHSLQKQQLGMFQQFQGSQIAMAQSLMGGAGGMGGGGGGAGGPWAMVAQKIVDGIQKAGAMIDARVDRGRQYALPADRLSVLLQQQNGISQNQVMNQMRMPLTNYRLGAGGINELLALQSRTGLKANAQMGAATEALRTVSGYGYSTADIANMTESMAGPNTANRMFMMMGTGIYGIGGKQKDPMQVIKDTVNRLGLTSKDIVDSGLQKGSVARQKLEMAGFDENMQTMVLQYAQSNLNYRDKGGKGMYDPSKKADRERMGIENNYATQVEETQRVEGKREENFYKRQADNFSQLEKNMQKVTKLFGELEDSLSTIIGAKTSTRGFGKIFNTLGNLGIPGMNSLGNFLGDPAGASAETSRIASTKPTSAPKYGAMLEKLKPQMREPLERMLKDAGGRVGIGQTYRSADDQKKMFLERYYKTDKKTGTFWNGSYWEKKPGVAAATPPGMSMHEIGLAADLTGDLEWVKKNAGRYGLESFDFMGEPWHIQLKGIPRSRSQYEKAGAPFGTNNSGDTAYSPTTTGTTKEVGPYGQTSVTGGASNEIGLRANSMGAMSMGAAMATFASSRIVYGENGNTSVGSAGGSGATVSAQSAAGVVGNNVKATDEAGLRSYYGNLYKNLSRNNIGKEGVRSLLSGLTVRGRRLTPEEINGFVQIAGRESGYNSNAYNPTVRTDDISFGLFQLNMDPSAGGTDAFRKFPWLKGNYDKLWDPKTNVDVAAGWKMADGVGRGNIFYHWGGTPENPMAGNAGYKQGDPAYPSSPGPLPRSGGSTNVITVAPVIHINTTGSTSMDINQMAKEVSHMLEKEIHLTMMRAK
jgi:hypothetical protein